MSLRRGSATDANGRSPKSFYWACAAAAVLALLTILDAPLSFEADIDPVDSTPPPAALRGSPHPPTRVVRNGAVDPVPTKPRRVDDPEFPHPHPRPLAESRDHYRVLVSRFVYDHVLRGSARQSGGSVEWVLAETDSARIDVKLGKVDAAVLVGESAATARRGVQRVLLGDFVVAVVVHAGNPVRELSAMQLRGLLDGMTRNWDRIGVFSADVRVHGMGRVSSFANTVNLRLGVSSLPDVDHREHLTLDAVAQSLGRDPGAIALLPLSLARRLDLSILRIGGFGPPAEGTRGTLAYPLTFSIVLLTGDRVHTGAGALAQRLQESMNLNSVDRSWAVRETPRRPGRKVERGR